jgi:hypothetical protein
MTAAKGWEFWPPWLFYAPVSVFVATFAARYGVRALPAANPGLPDGGLVGESKAAILDKLPPRWIIPFVHVAAGDSPESACAHVARAGWNYPLVAKPDVGQRGVGVRRVHSDAELSTYLCAYGGDVVLQPWHPGPFEAGVFYVRRPSEPRGRIFSITDKHFPFVVGDGRSSLEQLIRRHPRFGRQARVFLGRHAHELQAVLADGERRALGEVGNHAQGTMFVDGAHLITPALEARIDGIAQSIPGFFIGRFDVRYRDEAQFKAGEDLAIVELNGVTAESTNIYDPSRTLLDAYRTLYRQWHLVYQIGADNLRAGTGETSTRRLLWLMWKHLTDRRRFPISS